MKKYQFGKISQPILISVLIGLTALISVWIWLGNQNEKNDEHGHDGEDEQHDDHAKESKEDQHSEEGEIELTAQQMVEHGLKVETVTQG